MEEGAVDRGFACGSYLRHGCTAETTVADSPLVLVAGMHRSGTSAATRLLNLIGVSLGDEGDLMEAQPDNPRGFWEARAFSTMNDRLLLALGGSWDRPPRPWAGWGDSAALASWRDEAAQLVDGLRRDGAAAHAVKDPRFSLTLPLWLAVVPGARVVVPIRDPLATAQSLQRRNGIPIAEGAALWLDYVRSAIDSCTDPVLVDYADLLTDPRATALRLVAELDLPTPTDAQLEAAAASVTRDLDHEEPLDGPAPDELVAAEELYRRLRAGDLSDLGAREPEGAPAGTEVVLHIGAENVDDVSLSEALFANRTELLEAGVLYPRNLGGGGHWKLLALALPEDRARRFADSLPPVFSSDRDAWAASLRQKVLDEAVGADARQVVLSMEFLHSALRDAAEIRRLRDFAASLGESVRVVVYLARQDRAVVRRWQRAVLQGSSSDADPFEAARLREYDYEAMLRRWAEVFGEALTVRSVDDLSVTRRDLLEDFVVTAHLPVAPASLTRPAAPEAPSTRAHAAMAAFERIARAELPDGLDEQTRSLVARVADEVLPRGPVHPEVSGAYDVVQRHREGNRRVAGRWLGREELFDHDFSEYGAGSDDGLRLAVHLATRLQEGGTAAPVRLTDMTEATNAAPRRAAILHYHLFKNAGTSLDALLKEQFPGRWVTAEFPGDPVANRTGVAAWVRENPEAACYSSHTALMPPPQLPDVDLVPVIFLRHPLDRIASAYSFETKQRDDGFGAKLARNTTLRGYIEVRLAMDGDRQCRNFQVDRLAGLFPERDGSELERALRAVQELPFVGIVESFDESLARLEDLLHERGFPDVELRAVRRNVSAGRADSLGARLEKMAAEVGPEFFDELVRVNADDIAVYQAAASRFGG